MSGWSESGGMSESGDAVVELLFATRNAGKLAELEILLGGIERLSLRSLKGLDVPEVIEDKDTFIGNATKKAIEVSRATGLPALADDSGLCVDALSGAPGVFSARYADRGDSADSSVVTALSQDDANNIKLVEALADVADSDRTARFRSVLVLADVRGRLGDEVLSTEGHCQGQILRAPRGTGGFGYDPLFWVPELQATFAELGVGPKNQRSHRAVAMRAMRPKLLEYFGLATS